MKRRLNILCLMVIFVLSYSVLEAGYFFFMGAKLGVESVAEKEDTHALRQKLMHMKYISLESHSFTMKGGELFSDSVYNEKTGKYVLASYSSMVVSIDDHPALWEQIVSKLLTFMQIGAYVWAIVLFVRLIISINKSDIFNWKNVRRLRRLGLALIISFCCSFSVAYITLYNVGEVFSLRGYTLELSGILSGTMLVLGLCSLIVGEVFAIGLKMKEEQDLTI